MNGGSADGERWWRVVVVAAEHSPLNRGCTHCHVGAFGVLGFRERKSEESRRSS